MAKITKDFNGTKHTIEGIGWNEGKAYIIVDGYMDKALTMYYRHERTWDDHMGNTPCGYYINVRLNGHQRRVYASELMLFGR